MKNTNKTTVPIEKNIINYSLDRYTKIVLSIIAVCLLLITSHLYLSPSNLNALEQVQDVNIKSINGSSIYGNDMPVNLQKINNRDVRDNIPVNIQQTKGWDLWDNNIPVDIKSINGNVIYGSDMPIKVR